MVFKRLACAQRACHPLSGGRSFQHQTSRSRHRQRKASHHYRLQDCSRRSQERSRRKFHNSQREQRSAGRLQATLDSDRLYRCESVSVVYPRPYYSSSINLILLTIFYLETLCTTKHSPSFIHLSA